MDDNARAANASRFVLVTGGTGFVGRHLCPALINAGFNVRAIYIEPELPGWAPKIIDWVKIPPLGPETQWDPLLKDGITDVVHLAAVAHRISAKQEVPDSVYDKVNHQATQGLAKAVARQPAVRRLVFVSSIGAVTSLADELVTEETPCNPDTAYGRSKLAAEAAIRRVLEQTQTEWCIFRPTLLYGPGNPGNMERLLQLLKLHLPLPLGSVRNRRTFLYVGNLVNAICVALEHPAAARKVFCISDGQEMSTPELLRGLGRASGRAVRLFAFPMSGLRLLGGIGTLLKRATGRSVGFDTQAIEKLCGSLSVDNSLFRRTCGWTPPYTVEEGLLATVGRGSKG